MAKRIKKSEIITKVAVDNHIARTHAQIVVALVLDAVEVGRERGEKITKSWIAETIRESRESVNVRISNLSAFNHLVG
jgi:nucleoid DNA-binding protein